jgi:hypothetical protein
MPPTMQNEKVKLIQPWTDDESTIDVDKGIASLLQTIWCRGLPTLKSSQDDTPRGYVMIAFASWSGVVALLDMVARSYRVDVQMIDQIPDVAPDDGRWFVRRSDQSVRFPRRQLDRVVMALRAAAERSPAELSVRAGRTRRPNRALAEITR